MQHITALLEVRMRKRLLVLSLAVFVCGRSSGQTSSASATPPLTVIKAGLLIDGETEAPRKNQLIFVRGIQHDDFDSHSSD